MGPNMPVSVVCESAADCGAAIRGSLLLTSMSDGSLSHGPKLEESFSANAKRALLTDIEYEYWPDSSQNTIIDELKLKYTVMNGNVTTPTTNLHNTTNIKHIGSGSSSQSYNGNGLKSLNNDSTNIPAAKKILYPRENVQIGWKNGRKWQVGAGMMNVGNTCYLNSTLQALFHVPAFANWLFSDEEHRRRCEESKNQNDCIICAMARTLKDSQDNQQAIKPWPVYSKLRLVCKHLVPGHQEDAHEFLRYLVEAMEKAYLLRIKNSKEFDQYTKETTPLNQILGGYLKSSVRCLACGHVSVTFQHFEDLLLDIRKVNSIEEALETHFACERLEDMGYKCESCKKKVSATKQFSLERAPISLCIQLKRFSMMGGKINKHVTFRPKLDLSQFSSKKNTKEPLSYRLVALVTHLGASQHCGHYTAIGLTSSGAYHHFDDSCVRPISMQSVLQTNAYIMFYELEDPAAAVVAAVTPSPKLTCTVTSKTAPTSTTVSSTSAATGDLDELIVSEPTSSFIGPVRPPSHFNKSNGTITGNGFESSATCSSTTSSKLVLNISNTNNLNKSWSGTPFSTCQKLPKLSPSSTSTSSPTVSVNGKEEVKSLLSNGNHTINGDLSAKKASKQSNGHHNDHKSESPSPTKPTLPSMPKLNSVQVITNGGGQSKVGSDCRTTTIPSAASGSKHIGTVKISNGFAKKPFVKSLVPYSGDDDSSDNNNHSDDDDCKSTPIIKTKAGDFQVTNANGCTSSSGLKRSSTTEGSDATVSKLMKLSNRGYCATVNAWNGQPSNLDKEVKQEKVEEQRRKREIDADEEMDRGRQKKLKQNQNSCNAPSNPGYNPFQENQNQMNGNRYNSHNGGNRYKSQNFNRNNNHQQKTYSKFHGHSRGGYRQHSNSR